MASTITSVIELLVGLACLGLGVAVWPRMRLAAALLWIAGAAAAAHAVVDLV